MQAYEVLQNARAAQRPSGKEYIQNLCSNFFELRGDRRYGDDHAIIGGIGRLGQRAITVIAHERGHTLAERTQRNFGMAHPEGYRKALRLMQQAEKFNRPILCLVDTSGAFCGIEAEERGQGYAIAENLCAMMGLHVPMITLLIGEGGSGGALALAVADEVWMMQNSVYSVISPEGCSSILWKTPDKVKEAAQCLKITPDALMDLGIIERIVPEPGDAIPYPQLKDLLTQTFDTLCQIPSDTLRENRYQRFRKLGLFEENN